MGPNDPAVKRTREHSAPKQLWPNRGRHNAFPLLVTRSRGGPATGRCGDTHR